MSVTTQEIASVAMQNAHQSLKKIERHAELLQWLVDLMVVVDRRLTAIEMKLADD